MEQKTGKQSGVLASLDWWTIAIYVALLAFGWMSVCGASYSFNEPDILSLSTRSGMQALVDFAATRDLPFKLIVAGYGTETLKPVSNPQIVFRGTLSNEDLEKLLVDIDGIVIYQPPTTGALTRIPEMLLAGIPVFANFNASRNYFGIAGIEQYNTFDELFEILKTHVDAYSIGFERDDSAEKVFSCFARFLPE